jgi:phenylalanine-4-hydroxylase
MAVGDDIVSVFSGAADKNTFEEIAYHPKTTTYHPTYTEKQLNLHRLYQRVRNCREQTIGHERLAYIWEQLQTDFPDDWLCALEILEILDREKQEPEVIAAITQFLKSIKPITTRA